MPHYGFLKYVLGIWFAVWAFRKRYDVDENLDLTAQILRWTTVTGCFALAGVPGTQWSVLRLASGFIGLSFLCWPNFAYRLRNAFRKKSSAEDDLGNLD